MERRVDLASVGLLFAPRNDADAYDTDEGEYSSSRYGGGTLLYLCTQNNRKLMSISF